MSDVKRFLAPTNDTCDMDSYQKVVLAADYDALLAKFDQAWKSASSESHAWAREYEARMLVVAERDQLRAELDAIRGQEPVGHQFQDREGAWHGFVNEAHYLGTVKDGTWPIRAIYALPPQQPDAVSVPGVNEFAVEILRGALEGGSFDGGDIQEMGVKYGLLFPEQRTEPCCESGCSCAEFGFPAECFRIARALLSTRQAEEDEPCAK